MSSSPEPLQLLPADEYEADEAIARLTALARKLRDARRDRAQSGLRLDLGFRGQRFVAPWKRSEQFFRNGLGTTPLEVDDPDIQRFLSKWANGPLCYGYPCYVNDAGHVLPLLFCEVRLRLGGGGQIQVQLDRDSRPQINQRILIEHGFDRSTTDSLISDLTRRDFDSFDACLSHMSELLGSADIQFQTEQIDPWPLEDRSTGWRNSPILFAPVEEQTQANIAAELQTIEMTIEQASRHTSLHAFFDDEPRSIDRTVEPVAPFVADMGRDPVLATCLSNTLSYLVAPPGSGRLPFIGNLIASQIVAGGSVLFVSPHGHVIDQVAGQLEAVLQRSGCWIQRLEKKSGGEELAKTFDENASLQDESPAPNQSAPQIGEARPTAATDHLADVEGRLTALKQAQWRFSVARGESAETLNAVSARWHLLFRREHELSLDRPAIESLVEKSENLESTSKGQGLRRILGKPDNQTAYDDVVRELVSAISTVPTPVSEALEPVFSMAAAEQDQETLAEAARALLAFLSWKEATLRADEAADDISQLPEVRTLARHFSAAQSVINKADRIELAQSWNSRISTDLTLTSGRLHDFLSVRSERNEKSRPDDWLDRKLTKAMRDIFASVPLWTGRVESIVGRLPLNAALFDLVVIEDAQAVDAGALFPLLYRARQAVVIGTRSAIGHNEATAAGLMRETNGSRPAILRDCARGHPAITWALSQSVHAGELRSIANAERLTEGIDPQLSGLHWHACSGKGDYLADPQLDSVLSLIQRWHEDGLFNLMPPRMVGIACACPSRRGLLMGSLANLLPKTTVLERIAIAGPERFHSQVVDFLVIVPQQDGDTGSERSQRLAQSALLYHDALGAAKIGAHIVADFDRAISNGGLLATIARLTVPPTDTLGSASDISAKVAQLEPLLDAAGVSHHRVPRGLLAFGQLGTIYEFVVPGGRNAPALTDTVGNIMAIDILEEDLIDPNRQLNGFLSRLV